jgi:hypothetical protein
LFINSYALSIKAIKDKIMSTLVKKGNTPLVSTRRITSVNLPSVSLPAVAQPIVATPVATEAVAPVATEATRKNCRLHRGCKLPCKKCAEQPVVEVVSVEVAEVATSTKCTFCNADIEQSANFCAMCGTKVLGLPIDVVEPELLLEKKADTSLAELAKGVFEKFVASTNFSTFGITGNPTAKIGEVAIVENEVSTKYIVVVIPLLGSSSQVRLGYDNSQFGLSFGFNLSYSRENTAKDGYPAYREMSDGTIIAIHDNSVIIVQKRDNCHIHNGSFQAFSIDSDKWAENISARGIGHVLAKGYSLSHLIVYRAINESSPEEILEAYDGFLEYEQVQSQKNPKYIRKLSKNAERVFQLGQKLAQKRLQGASLKETTSNVTVTVAKAVDVTDKLAGLWAKYPSLSLAQITDLYQASLKMQG